MGHRDRRTRAGAALLTICLIAGCSGNAESDRTSDESKPAPASSEPVTTVTNGGGTLPPPAQVQVGDPPTASEFIGTPAELAVAMLDALADDTRREPATLAAFTATGLPVLAGAGVSVTTDSADVVGLPWSVIWLATQSSSAVGLRGQMRLLGLALTGDGALAADVADATIVGLQQALTDPDPVVQLLALLVAESARRTRGIDFAALPPGDEVFVDQVVTAMVMTAALRGVTENLLQVAAGEPLTAAPPAGGFRSSTPVLNASDCSSTAANYTAFVVSKVSGGLGGVGNLGRTGGWFQRAANGALAAGYEHLGGAAMAEIMGKVTSAFGAGMNIAALAATLGSREADAVLEREPLLRTKSTRKDGEVGSIAVKVISTAQADAANCALLIMSALGNNTLLSTGVFAGVEVMVDGVVGFASPLASRGAYMWLGVPPVNGVPKLKGDTDDEGVARFPVQGRAQPKEVPESAPGYERPFSIFGEATLSPTDGWAILKTFLDGILCASQVGTGCADVASDIASQFHWDLGEFDFKITDWQTGLIADVSIDFQDVYPVGDSTRSTRFGLVATAMPLTAEDPTLASTTWTATVKPELVNASNDDIWTGGPWLNESTVTVTATVVPPKLASGPSTIDVGIDLAGGVAFPWDDETEYFAYLFDGIAGRWTELSDHSTMSLPATGGTATFTLAGPSSSGGTQQFTVTVVVGPA